MPSDLEKAKAAIVDLVFTAERKLTPVNVVKTLSGDRGLDRNTLVAALRSLVADGQIAYTYVYGTSFVERSYDGPFPVCEGIVVKSPRRSYLTQSDEITVDIDSGAAFGNGAHPSTCLALSALRKIMAPCRVLRLGLDMGTGSGILAIAMAKLGVEKVIAVDIDPCALSEAAANAAINGVGGQVTVTSTPLDGLPGLFSIIAANLASPTLGELAALFSGRLEQGGWIVVTGFKAEAVSDLAMAYGGKGLTRIDCKTNRGWAGMTFRKS